MNRRSAKKIEDCRFRTSRDARLAFINTLLASGFILSTHVSEHVAVSGMWTMFARTRGTRVQASAIAVMSVLTIGPWPIICLAAVDRRPWDLMARVASVLGRPDTVAAAKGGSGDRPESDAGRARVVRVPHSAGVRRSRSGLVARGTVSRTAQGLGSWRPEAPRPGVSTSLRARTAIERRPDSRA